MTVADAEKELRARADDFLQAMNEAASQGVNVQQVMTEMIFAAYTQAGEDVPPMLKMLLG